MKSTFQTIVIAVFVVAAIVAIAIFSGIFGSSSNTSTQQDTGPSGSVAIWGTVPYSMMEPYVQGINDQSLGYTIQYEEHTEKDFYQDLITALANNAQPDVVLFPSELLHKIRPRLYAIPFAAYSERSFRDLHVDGAQIFLSKEGIIAMPMVVDPMVTYFNKDILATRSFVAPPLDWTTMQQLAGTFVERDAKNTISQAEIALGGADNVNHARDILSAMFLQTGNSIISRDPVSGANSVMIAEGKSTGSGIPTEQALTFYTSFINPLNRNYSWNNAMDDSLTVFLSGKSAFYLGRASELFILRRRNPNLNFDVVQMFQPKGLLRPITYGSFISFGVIKNAPNFKAAYAAVTALSQKNNVDTFSKLLSLPPVRRDLLLVAPSDPYVTVFFKAALASFSWPDPDNAASEKIFRDMVVAVSSGSKNAITAISDAARDLQNIIR